MVKKLLIFFFIIISCGFSYAQDTRVVHYDNVTSEEVLLLSKNTVGQILDSKITVAATGKPWDQLVVEKINLSGADKKLVITVGVDSQKYEGTGNYEIVYFDKNDKRLSSEFHRYNPSKLSSTQLAPEGAKYAKVYVYVSREKPSKKGDQITFTLKIAKGNQKNVFEVSSIDELYNAAGEAIQGDTIKLRRGIVYYLDKTLELNGISLTSYGVGPKPIVSGFSIMDVAKNKPFKRAREYGSFVWSIDLSSKSFEGTNSVGDMRNIGFIYDRVKDEICFGRKCNFFTSKEMSQYESSHGLSGTQRRSYLSKDGDFLQRDENTLFVYSKDNPNKKYGILEFANHFDALDINSCTISGIRFEGFGKGVIWFIGTKSDSVIKDCEFDLIGGSCQSGFSYGSSFVRYGGSICVWLNGQGAKNIVVENNLFKRNFDAAVSPQGSFTKESNKPISKYEVPENIFVRNNFFINCRQAYELFYSYRNNEASQVIGLPVKGFSFDYNVCVGAGNNGFDAPEERDCHIYNGLGQGRGCHVDNNLFVDGGLWYWSNGNPHFFAMGKGNSCYIRTGQLLCNSVQASDSAIAKYRKSTADNNSRINISSFNEISRMIDAILTDLKNGIEAKVVVSRFNM